MKLYFKSARITPQLFEVISTQDGCTVTDCRGQRSYFDSPEAFQANQAYLWEAPTTPITKLEYLEAYQEYLREQLDNVGEQFFRALSDECIDKLVNNAAPSITLQLPKGITTAA